MNLKKVLEKGYLPKELPPPFNSQSFANKNRYISAKWGKIIASEKLQKLGESRSMAKKRFQDEYGKYNSSQLAIFSLAKGIYSRRKLGIPNPKQFSDLSKAVIDNWSLLRSTYKLSVYSESTPVEARARRAVRTKSTSWNNFKFQLIEKSFDKKIQLTLDISQFYPTIYTHSIPWAILGKEKAKRLFKIAISDQTRWQNLLRTNRDAKIYKSADLIDTLVRNCNDRQSVGLCIGPDTSLILAEVIGNRIDEEIEKRLNSIPHTGTRYYDDYYFYLNSRNEAENALKIIQHVLYEFQLETNENKVGINKLPFKYIEDWSEQFDRFNFDVVDKYELRNFFSILHNAISNYPKNSSWIIGYALKQFQLGDTVIEKENWDFFLSFILQTLLIDSSTIDVIFEIIFIYKIYLDNKSKQKIKHVLISIIKEHLILNHSFEVSWSLWMLITFRINCPKKLVEAILESKDSISKLLCLHLIEETLYDGRKPNVKKLKEEIKNSSSFGENWLLIYETIAKKWIEYDDVDDVLDNDYFGLMLNYDVSFYNIDRQIRPKVSMEYDFFKGFNMIEVEYDEGEEEWY
ncbi:RNA-directed DNA polymerase [Flagellimonas pacifica]|uniref:Reverse transcriptase (RNA-dependent DNA polymerase) n=1 Tax=Flagellimonas pacifica TaxID=1247520 RepID=A0A285MX96_9FLAO|nr:RNA-directed DNA polymerase [Allomuricauda parva]SNZ01718.1 Reverse transcriptase (RNA-dependent DNA polymerase) [Allomuricauda parva]